MTGSRAALGMAILGALSCADDVVDAPTKSSRGDPIQKGTVVEAPAALAAGAVASLSRSFDAPRLRADAPRSVAFVVAQPGGKGAIWELGSDARLDR